MVNALPCLFASLTPGLLVCCVETNCRAPRGTQQRHYGLARHSRRQFCRTNDHRRKLQQFPVVTERPRLLTATAAKSSIKDSVPAGNAPSAGRSQLACLLGAVLAGSFVSARRKRRPTGNNCRSKR